MFEWQRHTAGYEVVPRPTGELAIQPKARAPVRGYVLGSEHAGLYREFAALEPTIEVVCAFANRYGLLWSENADFELYEQRWLIPIAEMKALVSAYDEAARTRDPAKKRQRLEDIWALFNTGRIRPRFVLRMEPHDFLAMPEKCKTEPVPENLMAAMWLQFADQVSQGTQFKRCENCPTWFPVGPGTRTKPSKRFCSTRCRVAWHTRHKET